MFFSYKSLEILLLPIEFYAASRFGCRIKAILVL